MWSKWLRTRAPLVNKVTEFMTIFKHFCNQNKKGIRMGRLQRCLTLIFLVHSFVQLTAAKRGSIPELTFSDAQALDKQEDMHLLGVYAGSSKDCAEEREAFQQAVQDMQPVVDTHLVPLKGDEIDKAADKYGSELESLHEDNCKLQLVLLPFGTDKEDTDEYMVYEGPLEGKALQTFVTDMMPDHRTPEVQPETWEAFMTDGAEALDAEEEDEADEDASMPPMPPKVLLLTNKDHVPGVLKALALRFRTISPGLGFGWIRVHDEQNKPILDQLGPGKVPRLLLLLPMPGDEESGGRAQISVQPYTGAMRYSSMFTWLSQMANLLDSVTGSRKGPVDIPQLTADAHLQQHCVEKGGGVCVVGLLDLERSGSQKLIKMMGKVAGKSRDQPFYFSYVDAPRHRAFLSPFSVSLSDLPTAVAFNAARKRFAVLPEKMSEPADLTRFIDGVLSGRVKTLPFEGLPSLEAPSGDQDVADGEGAQEEEQVPVEEEFDLSDIMGEEVEPSSKEERMRQIEAELQVRQHVHE
ncbi:hypothetical protein DUNSADRAFT_4450 [Dunaliella salina]|uniref:PDIA6-like C-terminal thioredoxin-like domain-containing protein n=1 Tax=Dunaliella salina TaxID=3046 RepID=A0ABQ7GS13_DUNSA|nr:hypothetical protein DUNSADRAFT_4450 [Dunaliella salina]|eukprot:KAF5837402.1 hypothetical protein DUNSADRAFT_4450 [Dunaliella salina]